MGGENGNEGDKERRASLFFFRETVSFRLGRHLILPLMKTNLSPNVPIGLLDSPHLIFEPERKKKEIPGEISPRKKCRKRGNEPGPFFPHQFFRLCRGVPDSLTAELSCGQLNRAERSWKPSTELGTAKVSSLFCPREKKRNLTTDEKMKS